MSATETQLSLTRKDGETVHIFGWGVLTVRSGKPVGAMCSVEDPVGRRTIYVGTTWVTAGRVKLRVDPARSEDGKVCLSIRAPRTVKILRGELMEERDEE